MKQWQRFALRIATLAVVMMALMGARDTASAEPWCFSDHKCWDTWFGDDACYFNSSTVGWACYLSGSECIQDPHRCTQDQ